MYAGGASGTLMFSCSHREPSAGVYGKEEAVLHCRQRITMNFGTPLVISFEKIPPGRDALFFDC